MVKYYSLAAAGLGLAKAQNPLDGVIPDLDLNELNILFDEFLNLFDENFDLTQYTSRWNNDLRSDRTRSFQSRADGSELILPVEVSNTADIISSNFFNLLDNYISFLNSRQGADFEYGAHHVGRQFLGYGYDPLASANTKDWNIIVSGGRLIVTWEGDQAACQRLATVLNLGDVKSESNKICSFDAANEYCHRHGGQLFIPDEFYWNFFFNPMCNEYDTPENRAHANPFGATYSNAKFWLNLQAVENSLGQWQVETTSDFHFLKAFGHLNAWTGVTSDGQRPTGNARFVVENLLSDYDPLTQSPNDPFGFIQKSDFDKDWAHKRLGTKSRSTTDMRRHILEWIDENPRENAYSDLNMNYISQQLKEGGLGTGQCLRMTCTPGVTRPQIQDDKCDQNEVRPLCVIDNIFDHFVTCPAELYQASGLNENVRGASIGHCGDNVKPVIVQNVFNYKGFYEKENGGQAERFFHAWGSGTGGAASKHNPVHVLRQIYSRAAKRIATNGQLDFLTNQQAPWEADDFYSGNNDPAIDGLPRTPVVELYINCYGSFEKNDGTFELNGDDKWYMYILKDNYDNGRRTRKQICESFGYRYKPGTLEINTQPDMYIDTVNNIEYYKFYVDVEGTEFAIENINKELLKDCRCDCETSRTFTDQNALISVSVPEEEFIYGDVSVRESSEVFCCEDGYEFVPDLFVDYYHIHTCDRCVTLYCRDEYDYNSYENYLDFWRHLDTWNTEGNKKRVWWTDSFQKTKGERHVAASIQGSCQPLSCRASEYTRPTSADLCGAPVNPVNPVINDGSMYALGHSAEYSCAATECCGQLRDTCVRDNFWRRPAKNEESAERCNPYKWSRQSTCTEKYCTTSTTPFSTILNNLQQIKDGERYTILCNFGYIAYKNGVSTNSRQADTICRIDNDVSGICAVSTRHDITCVPVTCTTNPPPECTFDPNQVWPQGSTVNCACGPGTCGQRVAQCTINPDGFTASWQYVNNGLAGFAQNQCVQKSCVVTPIDNAVNAGLANLIFNNGAFTHRCNAGFAMYQLINGVWRLTADGKTGTTSCFIPDLSAPCASEDLPCCSYTPPIDFECRPIQCADPCNLLGLFNTSPLTSWALGETAFCECPPNQQALIGDIVQDEGCELKCVETPAGGHIWEYVDPGCGCRAPMCELPCEIPHGRRLFKENIDDLVWDDLEFYIFNVLNIRSELAVNEWASYECNAGFELSFSHNDMPATTQQCAMQCYNPVEKSCIDNEINYNRLNPIAVMDPLNCYCKPKECRPLTDADLGTDQEWIDPSKKDIGYWPDPGFNTIDTRCKAPKFPINRGNGAGNVDKIVCTDHNTWVGPGDCVETACRVPREVAGTYWAPGLNVEHTCKSLDRVNIEVPIYADADHRQIGYTNPRASASNEAIEAQVYIAEPLVNVKNGAKYTFTCKKGWKPYFNVDSVMTGADVGPQKGDGFECSCEDGIWVCNHHCRCEGLCIV